MLGILQNARHTCNVFPSFLFCFLHRILLSFFPFFSALMARSSYLSDSGNEEGGLRYGIGQLYHKILPAVKQCVSTTFVIPNSAQQKGGRGLQETATRQ